MEEYNYTFVDALLRSTGALGTIYLLTAVFFKWKIYKLNECAQILEDRITELTYKFCHADQHAIKAIELNITLKTNEASLIKSQLRP